MKLKVLQNNNVKPLDRLCERIRNKITEISPKLTQWIIKKRKGYCCYCGDCCRRNNTTCVKLVDNKCSIYGKAPEGCVITPMPMDIMFNSRYKRCTFYYRFQIFRKRRINNLKDKLTPL